MYHGMFVELAQGGDHAGRPSSPRSARTGLHRCRVADLLLGAHLGLDLLVRALGVLDRHVVHLVARHDHLLHAERERAQTRPRVWPPRRRPRSSPATSQSPTGRSRRGRPALRHEDLVAGDERGAQEDGGTTRTSAPRRRRRGGGARRSAVQREPAVRARRRRERLATRRPPTSRTSRKSRSAPRRAQIRCRRRRDRPLVRARRGGRDHHAEELKRRQEHGARGGRTTPSAPPPSASTPPARRRCGWRRGDAQRAAVAWQRSGACASSATPAPTPSSSPPRPPPNVKGEYAVAVAVEGLRSAEI